MKIAREQHRGPRLSNLDERSSSYATAGRAATAGRTQYSILELVLPGEAADEGEALGAGGQARRAAEVEAHGAQLVADGARECGPSIQIVIRSGDTLYLTAQGEPFGGLVDGRKAVSGDIILSDTRRAAKDAKAQIKSEIQGPVMAADEEADKQVRRIRPEPDIIVRIRELGTESQSDIDQRLVLLKKAPLSKDPRVPGAGLVADSGRGFMDEKVRVFDLKLDVVREPEIKAHPWSIHFITLRLIHIAGERERGLSTILNRQIELDLVGFQGPSALSLQRPERFRVAVRNEEDREKKNYRGNGGMDHAHDFASPAKQDQNDGDLLGAGRAE